MPKRNKVKRLNLHYSFDLQENKIEINRCLSGIKL
jgi:hypothetical protein